MAEAALHFSPPEMMDEDPLLLNMANGTLRPRGPATTSTAPVTTDWPRS